MRGLWDHEQPLSPSLLRSAIALLAGLLAALALANIVGAVFLAMRQQWLAAVIQAIGGIATPFAVWLLIRILADVLTLQHRSHDELVEMAERPHPSARPAANGPAGDDGVRYPDE